MALATTTSPRPDRHFLVAHPAHFIALGFGAGLVPKAPGTAGTLVGLVIGWLLHLVVPPLAIAFIAIPLFFLGIWACGVAGQALGDVDSGAIVWDEIVAFLPLVALTGHNYTLLVLAFLFFRLFDIWKPFPIKEFEKRLKGGFGVMFDDLVAGCYTYVALIVAIAYMQ